MNQPISEGEKELVLELLPQALSPEGVTLALGHISPAVTARVRAVLGELEREGRARREPDCDIWRVIES